MSDADGRQIGCGPILSEFESHLTLQERNDMTRMWMTTPSLMCRKHLLGEHFECHKILGNWLHRKSLRGFLLDKLVDPSNLQSRHDIIAFEMIKRGYNHRSPIQVPYELDSISNTIPEQKTLELFERCSECNARKMNS